MTGVNRPAVSDSLFPNSLNADRSKDAVRFKDEAATADLTVPIAIRNNVGQKRKENKGYPPKESSRTISLPGLMTGNVKSEKKIPVQVRSIPEGLYVYSQPVSRENSTPAGVAQLFTLLNFYKHSMPLASGKPGTTTTTTTTTTKYRVAPHLPRGRFYSGDCPGAAAITIILSLVSSLRVSPTRSACMCYALSGSKPLSAYEPTGLPVINRPETNSLPWYCHPEVAYSVTRDLTAPGKAIAKDQPERRYVTNSN
jgi:hypothetical protein